MRRVIKFRGKRTDTGEWVYGSLILCTNDHPFILPISDNAAGIGHPVERDSVGQFTGFIDTRGKEIYENDLIRIEDGMHYSHSPFRVLYEDGRFIIRSLRYNTWFSLYGYHKAGYTIITNSKQYGNK